MQYGDLLSRVPGGKVQERPKTERPRNDDTTQAKTGQPRNDARRQRQNDPETTSHRQSRYQGADVHGVKRIVENM